MKKTYDNRNPKSTRISGVRKRRKNNVVYDADMPRNDWIEDFLDKEKNKSALAKALGLPASRISEIVNGKRELKADEIRRASKFFGISDRRLIDLLTNQDSRVSVVGYVGAGAEVFGIDDYAHGDGMYRVEPPYAWPDKTFVATEVRGDSLSPTINEGALLFFTRDWEGVPSECHYQLCIVKTADGRYLAKRVIPAPDGLFNLESTNAPTMYGVQLEWAARVLETRPKTRYDEGP